MLGLIAPLIVLGLVIFVHELGHFLAAKFFGVYAPRFSIGFGPALWRRKYGETEYRLGVLPLGGYVRMASRDDEAMATLEGGGEVPQPTADGTRARDWDPNGIAPFGPLPVPANRWFESKPVAARVVILLAGVTMNFLLALVILIGVMASYGRVVVPTRVVGLVRPFPGATSLGERLAVGDTILAIDGRPVATWNEIAEALTTGPESRLTIRTHRGEIILPDSGSRIDRTRLAAAIDPWVSPVIDSVVKGDRAEAAGVQRGDSVLSVNGAPVVSWSEMVRGVSSRPGDTVRLSLMRGDSTVEATMVTRVAVEDGQRFGRVGIAPRRLTTREPMSMTESISAGWRATIGMTGAIVGVVRGLGTGEVSFGQLGGPVAITRASVDAGRTGFEPLLTLLAFISVNLAVLNLLPIPILDGGQILMVLAEGVRGRPLGLRARGILMQVGLLMILLIFVAVTFNDIRRLFGQG